VPPTFADKLTDTQRIERARALAGKLVDHTRGLLAAAENNAVVLYSDALSCQIPRSFAANAFNELQRSMHFYFLVRLSAIWDKASPDRESLPSLLALIDKPSVRERIADDTYRYHSTIGEPRISRPSTDPVEQRIITEHWERYSVRRAAEEKAKVERWINFSVRIVPRVEQSFVAKSLRPFRDSYIAHNLDASVASMGDPIRLHFGDEAKLLRLTIRVVDRFHLALNGAGFAWGMAQEQANRNAAELWSSCRFDLSEE
jgi:AbiU2